MNFGGTLRFNKFACFVLGFLLFLIIYWRGTVSQINSANYVNLKSLLKGAIHASIRGGKKVAEGAHMDLNIKSKGETLEGVNDPVTDVDYASHCAMFYGLKNTFPTVTVISEEHTKAGSNCDQSQKPFDLEAGIPDHYNIDNMLDEFVNAKDVTIWIDPLDATKEYTEGLYQYVTTMVCIAINGNPIMGVIHYPFTPQTYWGWNTKQTSLNFPVVAHKEENKEHPRVVVSRSHAGKATKVAKESFGPDTVVESAAGAGYKVMGVVNGTYDVYLHVTNIKKWDLCAGDAILRTVNGRMTSAYGGNIDYSSDSDVVVKDGLVVTRYDHDYYSSRVNKVFSALNP